KAFGVCPAYAGHTHMVADNCRLSCQLDTLVLLTNRSAKLIRKCCKSGNYGYHFSLCGSLKDDTKPEKSS
ncbi:hypothetical protein, partial [Parabacteroides goldsteinii]|uniref:hypothetical protein n=2 Tax=Bacteroidota TaxID=976 RepID=UPI0022E75315